MTTTVDVRRIVPRERHPLIFSTFDGLKAGDTMELVNDHDPKPLFYQLQAERHGQFSWNVSRRGPRHLARQHRQDRSRLLRRLQLRSGDEHTRICTCRPTPSIPSTPAAWPSASAMRRSSARWMPCAPARRCASSTTTTRCPCSTSSWHATARR